MTESDVIARNLRVRQGRSAPQAPPQERKGLNTPPSLSSDAGKGQKRRSNGYATGTPDRRPHQKYRNQPCVVDGLKFDSKKEARRWQELSLWQKAGAIRNLRRQVEFKLDVKGQHICSYFGDFAYESESDGWALVVEDVKSKATRKLPVYRLKAKLMLAIYGIVIRET